MMENEINIIFPITIFYDASCPLCAAEMHTLKETDTENKLNLVDCSSAQFIEPAFCPITQADMMSRIHAQDAAGQWISGVDVFAIAYQASGFTRLGKFWGKPQLRPIFNYLYPMIADNRYWLSKTPLPYLLNKLMRLFAPS
jgi:predicted DCC family thiol-disulfide oxidoreductase YuxK